MSFYSDKLAEEYVEKRKGYQATDKEVFSYIDQISLEGKKVLDFGCGDGVHDQEFLDRGAVEVVGIDESPKMIEMSIRRFVGNQKVKFFIADGQVLPFGNEVFDLVFSNFVLHCFLDTCKPLEEIYRTLKPGGYFVATLGAYDIPLNSVVLTNTQVPIKLGVGNDAVEVVNLLKDYRQIRRELIDIGFEVETYREISNTNAQMASNHPYKDEVRLMTVLIVAKK